MNQIPPGKFGGCLPRETKCGEGPFPVYGTDGETPIYDWDTINKWHGTDLHNYHWWTPDQDGTNGCTTGMGVNVITLLRAMENKPRVKLAMAGLYCWEGISIVKDGDRDVFQLHPRTSDDGMNLETMFLILQLQGVPPAEIDGEPYVDPLDWQGRARGRWPGDWRQEAAKYRLSNELWDIPDSQGLLSGIIAGFPGGRGQGKHAVCQIDKTDVLGSYGEKYGHKGHGEVGGIHEWGDTSTAAGRRAVDAGIDYYGAFCGRATLPENADPYEGVVPRIDDRIIRQRRRRRWGRRR